MGCKGGVEHLILALCVVLLRFRFFFFIVGRRRRCRVSAREDCA